MPEIAFRIAALTLAIAFMTVRTVFERRLRRAYKATEYRRASPRDKIDIAIVALGLSPMYVYMLTPWIDFAALGLPLAVRAAGLVVTAGGVVLFWWSHAALGGDWSPLVERPPAGTLVTSGPYRSVRHPMYAAFLVYGLGMLLLTSNWLAGVPAATASLWMYFRRADREEAVMLETFGEEYRRYAAHTGRLLPGIGRGRLAGGRSHPPR